MNKDPAELNQVQEKSDNQNNDDALDYSKFLGSNKEAVCAFKDMLREKNILPFSNWEKELSKIVHDNRFLAIPKSFRRQLFEELVRNYASEFEKHKKEQKKEAILLAKDLLDNFELKNGFQERTSYDDFKLFYKGDKRINQIIKIGIDLAALFEARKQNYETKKRDGDQIKAEKIKRFTQMLQEFFQKAEIYSYIKWKNIKTKFEKDKRYYLIDTEHEKEYIYENLLKDYLLNKKDLSKSKPIKAENKTSQEDMHGQIQKAPVNINKNQQKNILDPKPERKESIRSKKHKSSSSSYSSSSSRSRSSHSKSSKSRSSSHSHSKKKHKKKHTRSRSRSRSSSRNRSKDKKRKNKYTENKDKKIAPERMDAEKPLEERKPRQNIKPKKPIKFSAEHGFQQMKLKEAEEGFNVMLAERIKSLNQPFREIEKILGNDPRFNSEYLTQELKEDLYDDFIREKKKEAGIKFKQALKEKVDLLNIYASFDDSIKIFADDKRFQALPKKDAEDLFRDFLRELRNSYLTDFERFLNETHYLTKDSPLEGEGYEELKNKLAEDIRYKRLDDFAEMRDRMIKKRIESIRQTYLQRGSKIDEIYKELLAERDDDDKEENQGEEKNE